MEAERMSMEAVKQVPVTEAQKDLAERRREIAKKLTAAEQLAQSEVSDFDIQTATISDEAQREVDEFEARVAEQSVRYIALTTLERKILDLQKLKAKNMLNNERSPSIISQGSSEGVLGKLLRRITNKEMPVVTERDLQPTDNFLQDDLSLEIKKIAADAKIDYQEPVEKMLPNIKQAEEAVNIWRERAQEIEEEKEKKSMALKTTVEVRMEMKKAQRTAATEGVKADLPNADDIEKAFENLREKERRDTLNDLIAEEIAKESAAKEVGSKPLTFN